MDELIVRLMRTLACEQRLRILSHLITNGETSPSVLANELNLLDSALSAHLTKLTTVGLIQRRRSGGWFYCVAKSPYSATALSGMISEWLTTLLSSPQKAAKNLGLREVRNGSAEGAANQLHQLIFDAATAFTDVRRLQLLRYLLLKGGADIETLSDELKMSVAAVHRQTAKLVRRGFLCRVSDGEGASFRLTKDFKTPIHARFWEIVRVAWQNK
jgi:DNA-binding MarR family transcriptional regulator